RQPPPSGSGLRLLPRAQERERHGSRRRAHHGLRTYLAVRLERDGPAGRECPRRLADLDFWAGMVRKSLCAGRRSERSEYLLWHGFWTDHAHARRREYLAGGLLATTAGWKLDHNRTRCDHLLWHAF